MAATKKMTVRVIRDGYNDLRYTAPQTRANLEALTELFGEAHLIVPRNVYGRAGMPAEVKAARAKVAADVAKAKAAAKASKPVTKKVPAKKSAPKTSKPATVTA